MYQNHFKLADDMIEHLSSIIPTTTDPFILSRYSGFIVISAVTVYELSLKDIFINFAEKKHNVFGTFAKSHFDRLNGRIKYQMIKDDYISRFGDKYLQRYKRKMKILEDEILRTERKSVINSYNNLVTWRNEFAHEGQMPNTVTFNEVVTSYHLGKKLIICVAETMQR